MKVKDKNTNSRLVINVNIINTFSFQVIKVTVRSTYSSQVIKVKFRNTHSSLVIKVNVINTCSNLVIKVKVCFLTRGDSSFRQAAMFDTYLSAVVVYLTHKSHIIITTLLRMVGSLLVSNSLANAATHFFAKSGFCRQSLPVKNSN